MECEKEAIAKNTTPVDNEYVYDFWLSMIMFDRIGN